MNRFTFFLLAASSIGTSLYAIVAYGFIPLGNLVHPDMKKAFMSHPIGIYAHIFGSLVALAIGPFQLSTKMRAKHLQWHKIAGRVYLIIGVLLGGLSGLYVAQFAQGGLVSRFGFSGLAICWLYTGWMAYASIRAGDVALHHQWMILNFSLTFAAVTLRIYLGMFAVLDTKFSEFYPLLSWLCWVPNLVVTQWFILKKKAS